MALGQALVKEHGADTLPSHQEGGFYASYAIDTIWTKDLWTMSAAAAHQTKNIRFGPNVTHVFLREPTLIAQQLATLDEISGGRAEAVVSTGDRGMMEQ